MKTYNKAYGEVVLFDNRDIVRTSGENGGPSCRGGHGNNCAGGSGNVSCNSGGGSNCSGGNGQW